MRLSIIFGILIFGIGLFFSFMAKALIAVPADTMISTFATGFATALYVMFSAAMLGFGAGLIVHWLLDFAKDWKAFVASIMLAALGLFVGVGASIGLIVASGWTALQAFFTFLTFSVTLFLASFVNLFHGTKGFIMNVHKPSRRKRNQ